ncbi:MAG: PH domain-containing protein [Anaerolineales bacterium]
MASLTTFPPPKQRGLALHAVLIAVFLALAVWAGFNLYGAALNAAFAGFVLLLLACLVILPVLAYRLYALIRAEYSLDRDNLHLVWGMRVEDIPISDVEWVRPANQLPTPLGLPWLQLWGGLLGTTRHPDIGPVEFLASDVDGLLLVATARRIYAISPADPAAFVLAFQRTMEMGSLAPGQSHSQYPSFVMSNAWQNPFTRITWLLGALVNIGLFLWVSIALPGLPQVSLGFDAIGVPLDPVPGAQLILLPLLSAVLFAGGWLAGLFFYRRADQHLLANLLWLSGTLSSVFFLIAVFFLLNAA